MTNQSSEKGLISIVSDDLKRIMEAKFKNGDSIIEYILESNPELKSGLSSFLSDEIKKWSVKVRVDLSMNIESAQKVLDPSWIIFHKSDDGEEVSAYTNVHVSALNKDSAIQAAKNSNDILTLESSGDFVSNKWVYEDIDVKEINIDPSKYNKVELRAQVISCLSSPMSSDDIIENTDSDMYLDGTVELYDLYTSDDESDACVLSNALCGRDDLMDLNAELIAVNPDTGSYFYDISGDASDIVNEIKNNNGNNIGIG